MKEAVARLARLMPRLRLRVVLAIAAILVIVSLVSFVRFAFTVQALRERRATGPSWNFPSRVYSAGLPFIPGRPLPDAYLRAHLTLRGYEPTSAPARRPGTYAPIPHGMEIALRGFDDAADPAGRGGPERIRVEIAGGRLTRVERLGALFRTRAPDTAHPPRLEPVVIATLSDDAHVRRTWIPLSRVPRVVLEAIIASEDRRFGSHLGLDLRSNLRALLTNARAGGVRQGGSTITQQLARGLFLGRERTWNRKVREVFLAVGLELLLSKDEILEMYLNSVYWGQDDGGGVAGIAEASRHYFGLPVESLDVERAALLAGLIPAPNTYSPFRNPGLARLRRNLVLESMVNTRVLDRATAERIARRPLSVRHGPGPTDYFPSFSGCVRDEIRRRLPAGAAEHWGLAIFTTVDIVWQGKAEHALADATKDLEGYLGRGPAPLEGAFVALEPTTGFIRAVVGGRSLQTGDFNRVTQARRQPGSAMKPVAYAAALDAGRSGPHFTPASTLPDLRREFDTPEGPWSPRNDENDYHSSVTLAKALAKSLNVATVNLVEQVGPGEVARYAERFGLGKLKAVASVGLGTNEVTLLALTDAYATFPNGGLRREPTAIRAVVDARGRVLLSPTERGIAVLSPETAQLMTGLLEDVVIFGISNPLRKQYGFSRPIAGKTGTTNDYYDSWFMGFTPDVAAGVWVGYDSPRSLGRPAVDTALPVWAKIMTALISDFPPTPFPSRALELAWIDPWTGGLARSDCPSPMRVPFVRGTSPRTLCSKDHTEDWRAFYEAQEADSLGLESPVQGEEAPSSDTLETNPP